MMLDDLELELRRLPGVRAAGFDDRDDVLMIQLHVTPHARVGDDGETPLPVSAARIAARHSDRPVAVEVIRWREAASTAATDAPATVTPIGPAGGPPAGPIGQDAGVPAAVTAAREPIERPRLLAVLSFPDTDELEVHLVLAGRRTIGRAPASRGLIAAVEATVEAIRALGVEITGTPKWSRALDNGGDGSVLVAAALELGEPDEEGPARVYGLAAGTSPIDAAARATLDALNRRLTRPPGLAS